MHPPARLLVYTDDTAGGVAEYNHSVLLALVGRGHSVTCVHSPADTPLVRRQAATGVRHEFLAYDVGRDFNRALNNPEDARQIFVRHRPDLVVFSNACPVSNLAAKASAVGLKLPFVIVEGFASVPLVERFADKLDLLHSHYLAARAVICVSHENHELLCRHARLAVGKGQVIYYGRPDSFFRPPDPEVRRRLRAEAGVGADAVLCFTAARLDPIKGYDLQLAAIRRLRQSPVWPRLAFAWAGTGRDAEAVAQAVRAASLGDRVRLLGQRADVADWLDAADVFVLPSRAEGMPLAVMEAMAKGLPVVASAVSGIPEELGPTGRLLPDPNRDPVATATALSQTLAAWAEDDGLRRQVGDACRERAGALFREGRMIEQTLAVLDRALLPPGDYVAPGLEVVRPDAAFPTMSRADPRTLPGPHVRQHVPHTRYADPRWPGDAWPNRDEAALLFNNARQFVGRPALTIGSSGGWSACHLALAGVSLDVIDSLLSRADYSAAVQESLVAAAVRDRVTLIGATGPAAVDRRARERGRPWSLAFIDCDAEGDGPVRYAEACARHAAPDAMILIHDMASPAVADTLDFLRLRGWRTLVYMTSQILGVAWRGTVTPVSHRPDPTIAWSLPECLRSFPVSGCPEPVVAGRSS